MYCRHCGNVVEEGEKFCKYCGNPLSEIVDYIPEENDNAIKYQASQSAENNQSKSTIGVLLGIFLGLMGLIIGLLLYPENTTSRATFMKGWTKGFIGAIVAIVVIYLIAIIAVV